MEATRIYYWNDGSWCTEHTVEHRTEVMGVEPHLMILTGQGDTPLEVIDKLVASAVSGNAHKKIKEVWE